MEDDAGIESGGEGFETSTFSFGDLDLSTENSGPAFGTPPEQQQTAEAPQGQRENPAWAALKDKLPKEFHPQIDPILRDWDQGVNQRFETTKARYSPYDEIINQGYDPQELIQAKAIIDQMNQSPLDFYENLKGVLLREGMIEEAQQVQQMQNEEEQQQQEQVNPELAKLREEHNALVSTLQSAAQADAQAQNDARLDQQIAGEMEFIESKVGEIPEWAKVEIINRAALMTEQTGQPVTLVDAYREFQRLRQQILSVPRPGAQAPRVVPGGGGFPAVQRDREALRTEEGRSAAIAEIVARNQQ